MISLETARQLLDFGGGSGTRKARVSAKRAEEQLEGAVAVHNLLDRHQVAYLADEVGLGKTYVALGAFALFRHFDPGFRLLVIAPKENIQRKWIKELHNFVRNNVRFADLRIRSIQGTPARPAVYCRNLYELARETVLDPDRDFFCRLTSFSFGLSEESEGWAHRRDAMHELLPWLRRDAFDLGSKSRFKENYARAVACALQPFDLVIIDEAHNLKHGLQKHAALRNRLLALSLGHDDSPAGAARTWRSYGPRAKRVLFLSATPVEDDYLHLWNQLDVTGFGDRAGELRDRGLSEAEKKRVVSRFLIRRVSNIPAHGVELTKNLYRREWREGGVAIHDEPLPVPGDRQRLIVALVQKKVSELLADERFNPSFQIGMLASFESFLRTAQVPSTAEEGTFDDSGQTDDALERQGIDVDAVNRLADSYERQFGSAMPHPKMDALVATLRRAFETGRKALIFVRRVASVTELQRKLQDEYDTWLIDRLRNELPVPLRPRFEEIVERYRADRRARKLAPLIPPPIAPAMAPAADTDQPDLEPIADAANDVGGLDTFFAWYFRGDGPAGVLSGAELAKRFRLPQFALSSFFEENYAAWLLDAKPGDVGEALRAYLNLPREEVEQELERRAGNLLIGEQRRRRHRYLFHAFQTAAVSMLADAAGPLREHAQFVLHQLPRNGSGDGPPVPLGHWLERATFFTELRQREDLYRELWVPLDEAALRFEQQFRRRELRRKLLESMFRLGHSLIDLYVTAVQRLERLDRTGDGDDLDNRTLAHDLLDLLERQRGAGAFRAWQELSEAAANFDLVVDVNAPDLWDRGDAEVTRGLGNLLREQQPVGGMWGEVNRTLVSQFRMPGYPLILLTTDLLQEGEDLHLFCSDVHHYGISWMPSSMEQRVGRVDRVRSHTERRITSAEQSPTGDELLQVYYPHLRESVEVFQVDRVLERMDRFMELMHESLGTADEGAQNRIDLVEEIAHGSRRRAPSREPLRSAFPVARELLDGPLAPLAVTDRLEEDLLGRFARIQNELQNVHGVIWDALTARTSRVGTVQLGRRTQALTLFLYSVRGHPNLRCVSPVGSFDANAEVEKIVRHARRLPVRVAVVEDPRFQQYKVTAELDVLLGEASTDGARAAWLVDVTTRAADGLEAVLLGIDESLECFRQNLEQEPFFER
jgi:hypothetical protein